MSSLPHICARRALLLKGRRVLALLLLALGLSGCPSTRPSTEVLSRTPSLETGDLIFLDLDCGPLCEAIEEVTQQQFHVTGPSLSHVGLIERGQDGQLWVWEAWPAAKPRPGGVVRTSLHQVLARVAQGEGRPAGYRWGRLRPAWRNLGRLACESIKRWANAPYDEEFLLHNGRFYCSELIYEAFGAANAGRAFFTLHPMSFGVPGSSARRTWESYYRRRELAIPEGQPGLSPLSIYLQGQQQQLFLE